MHQGDPQKQHEQIKLLGAIMEALRDNFKALDDEVFEARQKLCAEISAAEQDVAATIS